MKVLISNDDGIRATGLRILAQEMSKVADIYKMCIRDSYNADVVHIRMEPDDQARILDTVSRGEMFEIVDYDPQAQWQRLNYRGETAYISSDYIYMQEWESGTQVDIGTIVGDGSIVNVYRHPWPESDVVLNALKGAKFVVVTIDEESGWYQVGFPDGVGYIEPQYLDIRSTTIDNAFFG